MKKIILLSLILFLVSSSTAIAQEPSEPESPIIWKVFVPIIANAFGTSIAFPCDAINQPLLLAFLRYWGAPVEEVTLTCEGAVKAVEQFGAVVWFSRSRANQWCLVVVQIGPGAAVIEWHQDPPDIGPIWGYYTCVHHSTCYWIEMFVPDPGHRVDFAIVNATAPRLIDDVCWTIRWR